MLGKAEKVARRNKCYLASGQFRTLDHAFRS